MQPSVVSGAGAACVLGLWVPALVMVAATQPDLLILPMLLSLVAVSGRSNLGRGKWELSDIPTVVVLLAESTDCGCPYHGLLG